MNMKEWVNSAKYDVDNFNEAVAVDDINDLLKTHAIVPRKIPRETLLEIQSKQPCTIRKMIELFIEVSERGDD